MRFLFTLIVLTLLSCCQFNEPISSNSDQQELIPLKLNNTWYVQHTSFDSSGEIIRVRVDTSTICCDTLVGGIKYYKYSDLSPDWNYNDDYGLWSIRYYGRNGFGEPDLFRKYPCKKGDTFNEFTVASTDTLINSKIGIINCILYEANLGTFYIEDFSKPGVGQIRGTIYQRNSEDKYVKSDEIELLGYKF